jgi:hypothetical protein
MTIYNITDTHLLVELFKIIFRIFLSIKYLKDNKKI